LPYFTQNTHVSKLLDYEKMSEMFHCLATVHDVTGSLWQTIRQQHCDDNSTA